MTTKKLMEEKRRAMLIAMEGKGGVGKSTVTNVAVSGFRRKNFKVRTIESDTTNSSMSMVFKDTTLMSVQRPDFRGVIAEAAEQLKDGVFDRVVIDLGARDEAEVKLYIPKLARMLAESGVDLVIVRPITTSHFVQNNAMAWVRETKGLPVKTVFVRNHGMGRSETEYAAWFKLNVRAAALASGVVEVGLEDVGARLADDCVSAGLSFSDLAYGDFSRSSLSPDELSTLFPRSAQLTMLDWVDEMSERLLDAFDQVVA